MSRLSYRDAVAFLFGLEKSGIKLGLDRTLELLQAAGNPHRAFRSVHIAGTNGKGSVACYINSILFHSGTRTGLFTSPHLVDYRERIRVDGAVIPRGELAALVTRRKASILETGASFFEATTVLAFEYFADRDVGMGVVEVGMGGRLDSTNVLTPEISCITSIDFDHTKYLGRTLALIAGEKAGIIKPGIPVVCGRLSSRASAAIREIAAARKSPVVEMGRDASFKPLEMSINGSAFAYKGLSGERRIEIGAPGMHHIANAATAMLAVEVLRDRGFRIDEGALHTGFSKARWPGRLQVLKRRPLIICDAAHNVSGTRSLVKSLAALGLTRNVTVFGVLRDKDYRRMLDLLARCSDRFVLTSPESDRALPVERLEAAAREKGLAFSSAERVGRAVRMAEPVAEEGRSMLICGSLYALGEAMGAIGYKPYRAGVC